MVAEKVFEIGQTGVGDAAEISKLAIAGLCVPAAVQTVDEMMTVVRAELGEGAAAALAAALAREQAPTEPEVSRDPGETLN